MKRRGFLAALLGLLGLSGCVGERWKSVVEDKEPRKTWKCEVTKGPWTFTAPSDPNIHTSVYHGGRVFNLKPGETLEVPNEG